MKDVIAKILEKYTKLKKDEIKALLETPPEQALGDFSFPCFKLAGIFKKNPVEIAKNLAKEIKPKAEIIKIEAKGPYINFFIDRKFIAEDTLNKVDENYGESKIGQNKKVVIDFSGPNIGKPMHIGHIRSTIIGDSLMRIHNFLGYNTTGINYLGDIGLHIGKLIVAWELWLDEKSLKQDPVKELLRLYVKFCEKEKSEFIEGQEEDYEGNEWTNKAREKLKLIELGDKKAHKIWQEIIKESGRGFDRVYKILNVNFNETIGQSKFSDAGKEIIFNALKKGIAKTDETGAVFVEFEKLPKKYILRSNGTASYMTQDIGALVERRKKYTFDKIIYVTDYRQMLHFQQLFEVIKKFGFDFSGSCYHVPFGTVNFGKEIMATRDGKVVLLEDVLKKTIEKAKEEIEKRKIKTEESGEKKKGKDNESGSERASKIGVGAVKYIILRNEPVKDVEFSWEQALNFEGDSGPYLQYSYARANSIIEKVEQFDSSKIKKSKETENKIEEQELALIKKIGEFLQVVENAEKNLNPAIIASYAFQLSQTFNEFYHACKVIGEKSQNFRIKIIKAFMTTLKNALYLLGIEVMEEM
jgi:arginyl-tRNA synthetase